MTRRRSTGFVASRALFTMAVVGALTALRATALDAQSEPGQSGATFLLLPIGARAIGLGEAVTARRDPADAVWWNPAGLGIASRKEIAANHSQSFVGVGDAVTLVVPSQLLGVLALSANILDYGSTEARVDEGPTLGTILARSIIVGATYGTRVGPASAGVTFKIAQFRIDCSGTCPNQTLSAATTYAVDVGVQYGLLRGNHPLTLGAAVRNVGLPLQVNDAAQSDPLAPRIQLGAEYRFAPRRSIGDSLEMRISADVIGDGDYRAARPRFGAEVSWQRRAYLRGGYVVKAPQSEYGGPSIGLGLVTQAVSIDLSRVLSGFSADAGRAPTYLSLRIQY